MTEPVTGSFVDSMTEVAAGRTRVAIGDAYPPAHARYVVWRGENVFTATPCYGLHSPWWVVMTMNGEVAPVLMKPTDEWIALREFRP